MDTLKKLEALNIRVELDIWKGRRSVYGARRNSLKSEYVLRNDAVIRRERSVLKHLFKEQFEDKLAKEKREANEAKKFYEKVEFYIKEGDRRIPELEWKMAEEMRINPVQSSSSDPQSETERSLIVWCESVEEAVSIADSVTAFLTDLLGCIERSNNAKGEGSEISDIQVRVCEIVEKANGFFKRLRQEYGKQEKWKNIQQINTIQMVLIDERKGRATKYINIKANAMQNAMVSIKENALLYTIQDEMQNLQKMLVEAFAAIEEDGARLLENLKRECRDSENLGVDKKDKIVSEKRKKVFQLYSENENSVEYNPVLAKHGFYEEETLG